MSRGEGRGLVLRSLVVTLATGLPPISLGVPVDVRAHRLVRGLEVLLTAPAQPCVDNLERCQLATGLAQLGAMVAEVAGWIGRSFIYNPQATLLDVV